MNRIQSLSLSFSDRRNVRASKLGVVAGEVTTRILDDYMAVFVIEQGAGSVTWLATEAGWVSENIKVKESLVLTCLKSMVQRGFGSSRAW